jgi:hypothetical protein
MCMQGRKNERLEQKNANATVEQLGKALSGGQRRLNPCSSKVNRDLRVWSAVLTQYHLGI